jgi:hypothetical protein
MTLTRRSFIQSSLAAGLSSAAEATRSRWLLSATDRVRVGLAGLGASAWEHLALFAAIPGAEIVGLADSEPSRTTQALRQLRELGQAVPMVYRDVDRMLDNQTIQAISLPNENADAGPMLSRVLAAGLPVLSDIPPTVELAINTRSYEAVLGTHTLVHFRLADFTYPTSSTDLIGWLKRSGLKTIEAHLIIPRQLTKQEFRVVSIAAIDLLLAASPLTPERLIRWLGSKDARIQTSAARTISSIALPQNAAGTSALHVHLLGSLPQNAKLVVQHENGSLELAISGQPNADSSLRTVMNFLSHVRESGRDSNALASRAQIAAALVDQLMRSLSAPSVRTNNPV